MPVRVSFIPGAQQSIVAARYFTGLANEAVHDQLTHFRSHQYRIEHAGVVLCVLRIWCAAPLPNDALLGLLPLMHTVDCEVRNMLTSPTPDAIIPGIMAKWLEVNRGDQDIFLEKLRPKSAFTKRECVTLAISVVDGRSRMVSARRFIFMEHPPKLYGLVVGNLGSYLFEPLPNGDPAVVLVRARPEDADEHPL
jgi:hypothetical protein